MQTYKFPTRRKKREELNVPNLFAGVDQQPDEEPGLINGMKAASLLEWRVAKALWKLGRTFRYQHSLFGGRNVRGGFVIDFLIDNAPKSIPLEVQGEHWHTGNFSATEQMRAAMIEAYLDTPLVYVWENELQNDQDALSAVRKAIYEVQ